MSPRAHQGIEIRHARGCPVAAGGKCRCQPTFRGEVWSKRDQRKIRKSFASLAAARAWRSDAMGEVRRGRLNVAPPTTVREAGEELLAGMQTGSVRNRSGDPYKPSVIRSYESVLRLHVLPYLGELRVSEVQRADVQNIVDLMLGAGADPSTIRNGIMPLRVIFRRAVNRGFATINPTSGLELPAVRGKRDRIVAPAEAARLLEVLPGETDKAIWATALYAGLRRSEIMALRWSDVDLAGGVLRIERAWDSKNQVIVEPKSRAGRRKVPIPAALRDHLMPLKMDRGEGLIFGRTPSRPFNSSTVVERARRAWREHKLEGITLHEARHTYASLMIDAGVNAKALSTYMGHSSVTITYDRYGHLLPGNEDEAVELLDSYLARADTAARLAQVAN